MTARQNSSLWLNLWFNYQTEVFFGIFLSGLVALSFWLATYIPEKVFEYVINPMEYILTISVCFYGGWMMMRHHEGNRLRVPWMWMLFIWGAMEVALLVIRYGLHITAIGGTPNDPLYNASLTVGNIFAWMLFIYPSQVLIPGWLTWKKAFWTVLPMVIIGVIDYYVPANLMWLIMLYPVWIFLMLCWHVRKYRRWCEDNFSSMEMIDVQWVVRYLIILALLGISYYFIVFWYVPNRMFTQQWMLFLILAYGTEQILFRKDPWAEMELEEQPTQDYDPDWRTQLEQWMAEVKPYRNVDFRLDDLRQILPLNRTYLSQLINNAYGCNFFNWVNQYRLEEAKKLMIDHPEMKLTDVATYCGFSSLAVFSRAFTRYTGLSPRDWIRSFDMSES